VKNHEPVIVSEKTTKIVKLKKCWIGRKNEKITPQQIE